MGWRHRLPFNCQTPRRRKIILPLPRQQSSRQTMVIESEITKDAYSPDKSTHSWGEMGWGRGGPSVRAQGWQGYEQRWTTKKFFPNSLITLRSRTQQWQANLLSLWKFVQNCWQKMVSRQGAWALSNLLSCLSLFLCHLLANFFVA